MENKVENTHIEVITISLEGEDMQLHPWGGMYWSSQKILFISDTHFGKVSHFRKSGLAVPMGAIEKNWVRLADLLERFTPKKLIFLGDLFHSEHNNEWESFQMFGDSFPELDMYLVMGNHDILHVDYYKNAGIHICDTMELGPFIFSHHPLDESPLYNIYGHIHPSVVLKGHGRQRMKLPCFFFGEKSGIMPAFGSFTGTAKVSVKKTDRVYVIAGDKIMVM